MNHRVDEKLQQASSAYEEGYSCAQAVFGAYKNELGISEETAYRMMEGFSQGIGNRDGMCGVVAAASAIISYLSSDGKPQLDYSRTYGYIERIQKIFQKEYGGVTCREILRGKEWSPDCCQMKVKDMVLIIEQIIGSIDRQEAS